jgi:hypothetical protein
VSEGSFMRKYLLPAILTVACAAVIAAPDARADVYTWVDAKGRTHVSNLDPPKGARVTSVQRMDPVKAAAANAAREAAKQAEAQALAERVRVLENEVEAARRAPPQVEFRVVTVPAPATPVVNVTPPPMAYDYATQPQASYGCDPSWLGCGFGWYPGFYPSTIFVTGAANGHRKHPIRGGRPVPAPRGGVGPIPPPLVNMTPIQQPAGRHVWRPAGGGRPR